MTLFRRGSAPVVAAVLALALAACDQSPVPSQGAPAVERDSAGVRIVVSNEPGWAPDDAWTLHEDPEFVIGEPSGARGSRDSLHLMWDVVSAVPLSDGRVAMLAPRGDRKVLIFDRSGGLSASFGRGGRGPGELVYPTHLQVLPGDSIVVWDYMFGSVVSFDPSGRPVDMRRIDLGATLAAVRTPYTHPNESMYMPLPDGSFLMEMRRSDWVRPAEPGQIYRTPTQYVRVDSAYAVHSFGWWEAEEQFMVRGSPVPQPLPFPVNSMARTGGSPPWVYVSNGDGYEIRQLSVTGALHRILRRAADPIAMSEYELELWKQNALASNIPLTNWVAWERAIARLPERLHGAVRNMHVASDGHLWVQDAADWEAGTSEWSVFGPNGHWLGTLVVPSLGIYWVGEDIVLGADVDYVTGVRKVTGFRLDRRGKR